MALDPGFLSLISPRPYIVTLKSELLKPRVELIFLLNAHAAEFDAPISFVFKLMAAVLCTMSETKTKRTSLYLDNALEFLATSSNFRIVPK